MASSREMRLTAIGIAAALLVAAVGSGACGAEGFALKDAPGGHLDVVLDGRSVARYMYAFDASRLNETYKPYLHVMDAEGKEPITKGPGGLFPHHRGIFVGWSIRAGGKGADLWGMSSGTQAHQRFSAQNAGADHATFTSLVAWKAKDGQTLLEEERTHTFHRRPAPTLALVDFVSKLKAVAGDVSLGGDPDHGGVQYRPANELTKSKTRYFFPKDKFSRKDDLDLPWAAESYVLGDKTYGVQQMNHPNNPKGTVWSADRDYGRFGAFVKKDLKKDETLELRYRFWVVAGEMPAREQLQREWEAFAKGRGD